VNSVKQKMISESKEKPAAAAAIKVIGKIWRIVTAADGCWKECQ
jgi:hypothetical protein